MFCFLRGFLLFALQIFNVVLCQYYIQYLGNVSEIKTLKVHFPPVLLYTENSDEIKKVFNEKIKNWNPVWRINTKAVQSLEQIQEHQNKLKFTTKQAKLRENIHLC